MKTKILIIGVVMLSAIGRMAAQGNANPILSEGKVWIYNARYSGDSDFLVYFTVVGTEEIDGMTCYRIDKTPDILQLSGDSFLLHEENGKLSVRYVDQDGNASWFPLIDFSLGVNDEREIGIVDLEGGYEPHSGTSLKVTGDHKIVVNGVGRRKMNLSEIPWDTGTVWVEGIGAAYFEGLLTWFKYPEPDNGIFLKGFKECQLNGKTIFTRADFGDLNSVKGITDTTVDAEAPIYDIMGRRVTDLFPGSIYIRDGRKIIGM